MKEREDNIKNIEIFSNLFKSVRVLLSTNRSLDSYWVLLLSISLVQKSMQDAVQGNKTEDLFLKK